MAAIIVLFHIVPLLAVMTGMSFELMSILFMIVNPMAVFIICGMFGVKQGFTMKLPLFTAVVFAPSVIMYYMEIATPEDVVNVVRTTLIYTIVYFIFAVISDALGAFVKKML